MSIFKLTTTSIPRYIPFRLVDADGRSCATFSAGNPLSDALSKFKLGSKIQIAFLEPGATANFEAVHAKLLNEIDNEKARSRGLEEQIANLQSQLHSARHVPGWR